MDLTLQDVNETAQLVNGKVYFPFIVDEQFKLTVRGAQLREGEWTSEKTYIDDKSFCKILDNYVWEAYARTGKTLNSDSMCPLVGGMYQIENYSPNLKKIKLPAELFGHHKLIIELMGNDEIFVCQEIEFQNTVKYEDYKKY